MNTNQYLDMEKDYLIIAPLNDEGQNELYENSIYKDDYLSKNLKYMSFHEDTYIYMEEKLFDFINVELDLLINMYEEVIVENDQLPQLKDLTQCLIRNSDDDRFIRFASDFLDLVQTAIDQGTIVGFCF